MQVEKLKRELEAQKKEKEALESRTSGAEKKIKELGSTIENVCYLFVSYFFHSQTVFFFSFMLDNIMMGNSFFHSFGRLVMSKRPGLKKLNELLKWLR